MTVNERRWSGGGSICHRQLHGSRAQWAVRACWRVSTSSGTVVCIARQGNPAIGRRNGLLNSRTCDTAQIRRSLWQRIRIGRHNACRRPGSGHHALL
eukprot:scaffold290905_cov28-Tisochrysis_lutea.AAC.2